MRIVRAQDFLQPLDMSTFGTYAYLIAGYGSVGLQIVDLSDMDSGSDHLGNPATGEKLTFDDCAASALDNFVDDGDSPTGSWQPVESLSAFNGEDMSGEWNLTIHDAFAGDNGVLEQYGLVFCDPTRGDCDAAADLLNWGGFQICFSGDGNPASPGCTAFDRDGDQAVYLQDYAALECALARHDY